MGAMTVSQFRQRGTVDQLVAVPPDTATVSVSTGLSSSDEVASDVRGNLRNRFYEPIVLLAALSATCIYSRHTKSSDLSSNVKESAESMFHSFVNKLSQICDSRCQGSTVTAFVVLQHEDHIEYRFGSNRRTISELEDTKIFAKQVLDALGRTDDRQLNDSLFVKQLTSRILGQVISFNLPRVNVYVRYLREQCIECMEKCKSDSTEESRVVLQMLEDLRLALHFSETSEQGSDTYVEGCKKLILAAKGLHKSPVDDHIRSYAKEGRITQRDCWCELLHAAGRLLSYGRAVRELISTRKRWPELFQDFEVTYVPSSKAWKNPLKKQTGPQGLCAEDIIGRMTSDLSKQAEYRAHAQQLQLLDLDDRVRDQAAKLKPIVHAECLILQSLVKDGTTRHPSRFFNGYKYIGCSKPTCRLCNYYFQAHPSGVQVRSSHGNLYPNWRVADLYDGEAVKAREGLMMKVLDSIRTDTYRALSERVSEKKLHDSNTEATYPTFANPRPESDELDDLESVFDDLHVHCTEDNDACSGDPDSPAESTSSIFIDAEIDDDTDGGVSLT